MIKIIAALTMLIDHIGYVLFPYSYIFRIIGRISMPLYAYCIARGFYYSNQHGTAKKYIRNMLFLALISQLPVALMTGEALYLNICFTWFFSLVLLFIDSQEFKIQWHRVLLEIITILIIFIPIKLEIISLDYGFCGIAAPVFFYSLILNEKESVFNYFLVMLIVMTIYFASGVSLSAFYLQFFSVLSCFIIPFAKNNHIDRKIPKQVFYLFYPVHIAMLLIINHFVF